MDFRTRLYKTRSISSILLLTFVLCPFLVSAQIRPLHKKRHNVNKLLKDIQHAPQLKTAGFGLYAIDMETGDVIADVNSDRALRPASTLKLLTTATALELYGPDHRFSTSLGYSEASQQEDTQVVQDIVIIGGGDPTLGSQYVGEGNKKQFLEEWGEAIQKAGIDSIAGYVIGDARVFSDDMVPPSWSWMNMGQYYGAGPCGLSIYDNSYSVFFRTSDTLGLPAEILRVSPPIPIEFYNNVRSDSISWDNSYIYGAPYAYARAVRGTLPMGQKNFEVKGSLPDPAFLAASELDSMLRAKGLHLAHDPTTMRLLKRSLKELPQDIRLFHTTYSPPLKDIILETNTHSINLFAEHCLIHSGIRLGAHPETVVSADSLIRFWKGRGMDCDGLVMVDGSGLSQYNAMTPRQMVWLLDYMINQSLYSEVFVASMAIGGETGTLEPLFAGSEAKGNIRAKSGTIDRVKAYAGYANSASGRKIAFSMVVNNFTGSPAGARDILEQLMIALVEFDK